MLSDFTNQKRIDPEIVLAAIRSLREKGWDINPYTVADEARIPRSTLYRSAELMDLLSAARGEAHAETAKGELIAKAIDEQESRRIAELEQQIKELEQELASVRQNETVLAQEKQQSWQSGYQAGLAMAQEQPAAPAYSPASCVSGNVIADELESLATVQTVGTTADQSEDLVTVQTVGTAADEAEGIATGRAVGNIADELESIATGQAAAVLDKELAYRVSGQEGFITLEQSQGFASDQDAAASTELTVDFRTDQSVNLTDEQQSGLVDDQVLPATTGLPVELKSVNELECPTDEPSEWTDNQSVEQQISKPEELPAAPQTLFAVPEDDQVVVFYPDSTAANSSQQPSFSEVNESVQPASQIGGGDITLDAVAAFWAGPSDVTTGEAHLKSEQPEVTTGQYVDQQGEELEPVDLPVDYYVQTDRSVSSSEDEQNESSPSLSGRLYDSDTSLIPEPGLTQSAFAQVPETESDRPAAETEIGTTNSFEQTIEQYQSVEPGCCDQSLESDAATKSDQQGLSTTLTEDDLRDLLKRRFGRTQEEADAEKKDEEKKVAGTKFVGTHRLPQEPPPAGFVVRAVPPDIRKACLVLGLRPEELTIEMVHQAWKKEMTTEHPDQGGHTESAVYVNTAKDTLFRWLDAQAPKLGKKFGSATIQFRKPTDKEADNSSGQ